MADAIDDQWRCSAARRRPAAGVATGCFAWIGMLADAVAPRRRRAARKQLRQHHRSRGHRNRRRTPGLTRQRAEPDAPGAAGGKSVGQALIEVEARSAVDRDDFDAAPLSSGITRRCSSPRPACLERYCPARWRAGRRARHRWCRSRAVRPAAGRPGGRGRSGCCLRSAGPGDAS